MPVGTRRATASAMWKPWLARIWVSLRGFFSFHTGSDEEPTWVVVPHWLPSIPVMRG